MGKRITDFKLHKANANKGSERGEYMIEASLREVGAWRSVGADRNGTIGVGNKTTTKWQEIANPDDVIIVPTDGTKLVIVQRTDLDFDSDDPAVVERTVKAAYYDNRAGEVSMTWDAEQVMTDLATGLDLSMLWHDDELDALMHAITAPPTLDELGDKYGEGGEQDFWPVIKVQVSPETKELYDSLWRDAPGTTDSEKFAALLGAVDAAVLGAE